MKLPLNVVNSGRGSQIKVPNRYDAAIADIHEVADNLKTKYISIHPKTILNKVPSPDLPFEYSMNPYQGCEHGCVYCYARPTHAYWGYGPGIDFEQKIMIKKNAPALLHDVFKSKKWKARSIMLSGNTDCYQPIEKKMQITRRILELCWEFRHPVGIITKNSLILRDLDILEKLASFRLVKVVLSITGLDEQTRRIMEPRTSTYQSRLNTLHALTKVGVPTYVMMAPIIPSINDQEIFSLAKEVDRRGALDMYYTIIRLNGEVGVIFKDWLKRTFPDRYDRVIKQIKSVHGGQVEDSRFGTRMRGEGKWAEIISRQFEIIRKKSFDKKECVEMDYALYDQYKNPQMSLF